MVDMAMYSVGGRQGCSLACLYKTDLCSVELPFYIVIYVEYVILDLRRSTFLRRWNKGGIQ